MIDFVFQKTKIETGRIKSLMEDANYFRNNLKFLFLNTSLLLFAYLEFCFELIKSFSYKVFFCKIVPQKKKKKRVSIWVLISLISVLDFAEG